MSMSNSDDNLSFNNKAEKILESNTQTLKEIERLLNIIEEIKKNRESVFKE